MKCNLELNPLETTLAEQFYHFELVSDSISPNSKTLNEMLSFLTYSG